MITYKTLNGRLGETMYMIYGLFYFCIMNKIPLSDIFLNHDYIGKDYYENKESIIKQNYLIFKNIEKHFVNGTIFKALTQNPEIIDQKYGYFPIELQNYDPKKIYILENYWTFQMDIRLFNAIFNLKKSQLEYKDKYKDIDFNKCCSLHIRRGDYILIDKDKFLQSQNKRKKLLTDIQILDEIDKFKKLNPDIQLLVFSDDIKWCKFMLSSVDNIKFMDGNLPYEDMILISLCKYNICLTESMFNECGILLKYQNEK